MLPVQVDRHPVRTLTAIAALALGIGAHTAIFTVVDTVLLTSLTYPDSGHIVQFLNTSPNGSGGSASAEKFNVWRAQTRVSQDAAARDYGGPGFNLTGSFQEQVHGIHVSEAYFRLFGAPVLPGRTFTPWENSHDGGQVVVISYGVWPPRSEVRRQGREAYIVHFLERRQY
jgi:putative ABC transport system permease protein